MANRDWTGLEERRLEEVYQHFTNKFIAVIFQRTTKAIKRKGQNLGLRKLINPSREGYFHPNIRTKWATKNREISKDLGRKKKIRIAGLRDKYGLTKILTLNNNQ
jgi:hypothetical protein